ncbi:putative ribonuclease BN [Megalodesulfovibrio gigas DSM 1382 = ATCC 19364]|uniref:Putative ribonuclease BN n=2 Tax=Megalodesulfovibrio gigas TaxID=879 RepID=T2G7G3_MEGG1|nr:putative ribonuclease BN [Megalodesulfovibrio gigas DSM 1382 = ATCC 19364]
MQLGTMMERVLRFLRTDLWIGETAHSGLLGHGLVVARWLYILWQSIAKDRLLLRASALTYATILSIVPFLAVAFSVLKGFDFQRTSFINDLLVKVFAGREAVVENIIDYIDKTNVKTLGAVGVGFLFVTVVGLFSNVESTFNTIWGAPRSRPMVRKVADYISVSCIFPVLMVMAVSLSTTFQSTSIMQHLLQNEIISLFYYNLLKLTPLVSVWVALSFLYIYLPNTHVRPLPALFGGMVAGTLWLVAQWAYVHFQFGAANYNAIYGSFAQLPLFLVWLYISWIIVLLGAEMSFTFQHYNTFVREARYKNVSHGERKAVALACLAALAQSQEDRLPPPSLEVLAEAARVSPNIVQDVLTVLGQANLVSPVCMDKEDRFGLIKSARSVRVVEVLELLDDAGRAGVLHELAMANPRLTSLLRDLTRQQQESERNLTLAELVSAAPDPRA